MVGPHIPDDQEGTAVQWSDVEIIIQDRHPAVRDMFRFLRWDHLPPELAKVSQPFTVLALQLLDLPDDPELSAALRKLREAKDCAVGLAAWTRDHA